MRRAGILAVIPLVLGACSPEESGNAPQTREGFQGETIVFKSNVDPAVVALHLDAGAYRSYDDVSEVGRFRRGTGAYGWSISRDLADPTLWIQRFHAPTWHDYRHLSQRASGRAVLDEYRDLLEPDTTIRVRRLLERPVGSLGL